MSGLRRALSLSLLFACAAALASAPAMAGPKPKRGKGAPPARADTEHVHVKLQKSKGPPPWAPAHGYRRKQANGAWVYVPPFGIDVGTCNRELLGTALGGAAGGLLASEVAKDSDRAVAIAGGAILGALIGGSIGRSMDRLDHHCLGQILEHAPADESVAWKNPDRESAYRVTAVRTYQDPEERYCREYQTTATIGGKSKEAHGTACRQPDGSWQIIN